MNKNTHIIELSSYTSPTISEDNREDWVDYGSDNNYYQFLIDRFSNSATNNAVINNICKLIYGKGLSALDANKKPNEYAQMLTLFQKDEVRKLVVDLKMLGQSALQIHYAKGRKSVLKTFHIPVHLLRAEKCNKDGEITAYYYSDNWSDTKKYIPQRIDAFGYGSGEIEILMIQPYSVGMKYYSLVDYQGALDYTVLEEKISEYLINEVSNHFSPTSIINFNNGTPTDEQKEQISNEVIRKLTGSKGKKVVVSFNDNAEAKTTIDSIPLNDAPAHYNYLSDEARNKILVGHNVTSPLLFGISSANGFSSNADELKNSAILFDNMVIRPFQDLLCDAFDKVLAVNGISLNLEFVPLQPLDASGELTSGGSKRIIDGINSLSPLVANKVLESMTANEIRGLVGLMPEQNGSNLQPTTTLSKELSELELYLDEIGEDFDDENWIIVDERDVDYEDEINLDTQIEALNTPKKNLLQKLASSVKAIPNAKSEQDATIKGVNYKVRYQYTGNSNPKRDFCKIMMKSNKLYRKEDLERANSNIVNPGFGHNGEPYNLFLFKGGPRCKHSFKRITFMSTNGIDVNSPNAKKIGTETASKRGYKITNPYQVSIQPNNLPNKGFHPNNTNLPSDVQ